MSNEAMTKIFCRIESKDFVSSEVEAPLEGIELGEKEWETFSALFPTMLSTALSSFMKKNETEDDEASHETAAHLTADMEVVTMQSVD